MSEPSSDLRCEWSDLPVYECAHCPADAREAARIAASRDFEAEVAPNDARVISGRENGAQRFRRVELFEPIATPACDGRPPLRLGSADDNVCACGQPTRDHAYACDDCADELGRILGDVPWLAEQLEVTITRQRAKVPGANGTGDGVPWHEKASDVLNALRNELVTTIRICDDDHVRHSSPSNEWPADDPPAMSRWLLWRVDGLTFHASVTETLRTLLRIEDNALRVIDRSAERKFLGWCTVCNIGAVYACGDAATGRCVERDCRTEYDTETARATLEKALDDRLCTASELARLSTYLGIPAGREQVRKSINQWHRRGRIAGHGNEEPRFRYGQVRVLLAQAYESRADGGA